MNVFLITCATDPSKSLKIEEPVYPPQIIEHTLSSFNGNIPQWVFDYANNQNLEKKKEFEGLYVCVFENSGKNLDGLKS
jgi:hypothetical protein